MKRGGLALTLLALSAPADAAPEERVTAGALRDWPPQYSLDAKGEPTGFAVDLMEAVAAEADLDVEYRLYDTFAELIADVEAGRIDVIPNYGITEERSSMVLYTSPVETFDLVLWVRAGSRDVHSVEDLGGRAVATVRANLGEAFVPDDVEIVYDDPRTALFDLLAGRVDGVVYPEPVLESLAVQAGVAERVRIVDPPLFEIRRAIAVRRDAPALRDRLDAALAEVTASGLYAAIYRHWYATPPPGWADPRVGRALAIGLLAGVLLLLAWRMHLQRRLLGEVQARLAAEEGRLRTERRLEDVLAAAPDGVFLTDPTGIVIDVNPAGRAMLGHPREAILGKHVGEFLSPDAAAGPTATLDAIRSGRQIAVERGLLRADGSHLPVEISASQLVDGTLVGIVRDVTQRKQAQAELLAREEQLQSAQRLETVGRLAGAVAHDFNNLLTVILEDAEFLRGSVGPEQVERAEEILQASHRAADLTRQLLAFSSRQVLQAAPTDPATVVTEFDRMMKRVLPANVRLVVHAAPGATILVDSGQLEQVLMNLVLNARDALGPEGGDIEVRCHTLELSGGEADEVRAAPGRYAVIEVSDTGHGMDAATRAQVFEPFFTTKALGRGTGLGLATVHGIVRQSGGWVDVRSEVGVGTAFRVGFPTRDAAPAAATPEPAPRARAGAGRVLVVEDEPAVRRLVVRTLTAAGYEVLEAGSGERALEVAEGIDLVAVLTDVVMPGLGGPALADRLTTDRPHLPILFMSGYADGSLDEALARPHRGFLPKPFTPDQLRSALAAVIHATDV